MRRIKFIFSVLIVIAFSALLISCSRINNIATELLSGENMEETDKDSKSSEFSIDDHMGMWYYSEYPNPMPEDYFPIYFVKTETNKAEIFYDTPESLKITFISENIAESYVDNVKSTFKFSKTTDGKEVIYISYVYADTGKKSADMTCAYREIPAIDESTSTEEFLKNSKRVWQDFERMSDIPESEIIISSISQNNIVFTLEFYRIDSFENIKATIDRDGIYFKNASGSANGNISGNIKAIENNLVLTITNSSHPDIKSGDKYTFSKQSDESILQ